MLAQLPVPHARAYGNRLFRFIQSKYLIKVPDREKILRAVGDTVEGMPCTQRPETSTALNKVLYFSHRFGLVQSVGTVFQIAGPIVLFVLLPATDQRGKDGTTEQGR